MVVCVHSTASNQFNKIEVQLETVIQPCALLTDTGGFEMDLSSALIIIYLIVALWYFCIGDSYLKV